MSSSQDPPTLSPQSILKTSKKVGRPPRTNGSASSKSSNSDDNNGHDGLDVANQLKSLSRAIQTTQHELTSLPSILKTHTESILSSMVELLKTNSNNNSQQQQEYEEEEEDDDLQIINEDGDDSSPLHNLLSEMENDEEAEKNEVVNSLFELLDANTDEPSMGPSLPTKIADSFTRSVVKEISKTEKESFKNKFLVPENLKTLVVPRVNPQVWKYMNKNTQSMDNILKQQQVQLSKAIVAQSLVVEKILVYSSDKDKKLSKEEVTLLVSPLLDSAVLLGSLFKTLSYKRRATIKISTPLVKNMCTSEIPVTEFLFGDNFDADLRSANNTVRLASTANKGQRFHPYQKHNGQSQSSNQSSQQRGNFKGRNFKNRGNGRGRSSYRQNSTTPTTSS